MTTPSKLEKSTMQSSIIDNDYRNNQKKSLFAYRKSKPNQENIDTSVITVKYMTNEKSYSLLCPVLRSKISNNPKKKTLNVPFREKSQNSTQKPKNSTSSITNNKTQSTSKDMRNNPIQQKSFTNIETQSKQRNSISSIRTYQSDRIKQKEILIEQILKKVGALSVPNTPKVNHFSSISKHNSSIKKDLQFIPKKEKQRSASSTERYSLLDEFNTIIPSRISKAPTPFEPYPELTINNESPQKDDLRTSWRENSRDALLNESHHSIIKHDMNTNHTVVDRPSGESFLSRTPSASQSLAHIFGTMGNIKWTGITHDNESNSIMPLKTEQSEGNCTRMISPKGFRDKLFHFYTNKTVGNVRAYQSETCSKALENNNSYYEELNTNLHSIETKHDDNFIQIQASNLPQENKSTLEDLIPDIPKLMTVPSYGKLDDIPKITETFQVRALATEPEDNVISYHPSDYYLASFRNKTSLKEDYDGSPKNDGSSNLNGIPQQKQEEDKKTKRRNRLMRKPKNNSILNDMLSIANVKLGDQSIQENLANNNNLELNDKSANINAFSQVPVGHNLKVADILEEGEIKFNNRGPSDELASEIRCQDNMNLGKNEDLKVEELEYQNKELECQNKELECQKPSEIIWKNASINSTLNAADKILSIVNKRIKPMLSAKFDTTLTFNNQQNSSFTGTSRSIDNSMVLDISELTMTQGYKQDSLIKEKYVKDLQKRKECSKQSLDTISIDSNVETFKLDSSESMKTFTNLETNRNAENMAEIKLIDESPMSSNGKVEPVCSFSFEYNKNSFKANENVTPAQDINFNEQKGTLEKNAIAMRKTNKISATESDGSRLGYISIFSMPNTHTTLCKYRDTSTLTFQAISPRGNHSTSMQNDPTSFLTNDSLPGFASVENAEQLIPRDSLHSQENNNYDYRQEEEHQQQVIKATNHEELKENQRKNHVEKVEVIEQYTQTNNTEMLFTINDLGYILKKDYEAFCEKLDQDKGFSESLGNPIDDPRFDMNMGQSMNKDKVANRDVIGTEQQ